MYYVNLDCLVYGGSDRKKPKRRLRTPKAVTRKHRHISSSSDFDLESVKPKSKSNSQLFHVGTSFGR